MKTWDSKSAAICTGLACLSAITKTSDGPAGMSIEIIASLFCEEIRTEGRIKSRKMLFNNFLWLDRTYVLYKFQEQIIELTWSIILAAVTYWLPGPKIFSTCDKGKIFNTNKNLKRCSNDKSNLNFLPKRILYFIRVIMPSATNIWGLEQPIHCCGVTLIIDTS